MTLLQMDAHEAAIAAARPLISQPWRAVNAAVDATITVALLSQLKAHDVWLENLPDLIRTGDIPASLVTEIAAACAQARADQPTMILRLPSRAELHQTAIDVPA